jgi:hypothetical protein
MIPEGWGLYARLMVLSRAAGLGSAENCRIPGFWKRASYEFNIYLDLYCRLV